ncbi:MAG TPA: glycosyltransferase family 9 protein, partial [Polyangiaceae bacterium]|nr:glycosyltransferase family 9 protein [Polyangiaceae bacterium]
GLVWEAGRGWDRRRAIDPSLLRPLAELDGVQLHLLQRGPTLAECAELGVVSGSDDVERAASVMMALDLVISVDSMPAHLAGALARPVWTLGSQQAFRFVRISDADRLSLAEHVDLAARRGVRLN